ncbi:MAG: ATPase [Methanolobus sp. T82-4]|nr:MAG: ATPase [Methanolobus sp. T82-4]
MSLSPEYFEKIREAASRRWDQLEQDPELAGPWHQLFKQVQSPRHIVSELLQNADDARATFASVRIENGVFTFMHNGEDFIDEHFASLCRFGYSNKRALHTIGFRGIGFKSTFSLGDRVELYTPTLSVAFDSRRFTEPIWIDASLRTDGLTEVRVSIKDGRLQREVEKNLWDWINSPVSLLFFKSIRHLKIQGDEVKWSISESGPIKDTEWVELITETEKPFLRVRSTFEAFPDDALNEIKQERMLAANEEAAFPPCQVEIILGAKGRLFVVLPTGVETSLPFACNAPFIQDPARMKIKDPETSPTNRWLLERIGKLAASVMLEWLEQKDLSISERSKAYSLLPDIDLDDSSLEGMCANIVVENFEMVIEKQNCLLTHEGNLEPANHSVIIPEEIIEVWPAEQAVTLFDEHSRPAFSRFISIEDKNKLLNRGLTEEITKRQILSTLKSKRLPKPEKWYQLLNLWTYVEAETASYSSSTKQDSINIIPVQGEEVLYSSKEVIRIGKKKILQSDEDWSFLSTYLLVVDNEWFEFLSDQKKHAEENKEECLKKEIELTYSVLKATGLENSSDASRVIDHACAEFFSTDRIDISGCIRIAQIAARLGAVIGNSFCFVTEDQNLRSISDSLLFDKDGTLVSILPEDWARKHLLHQDYSKEFLSCTKDEWNKWISSKNVDIQTFKPLIKIEKNIVGRREIQHEVNMRGYNRELNFEYKTNYFLIVDWDFDFNLWEQWEKLAEKDVNFWGHLFERLLSQSKSFWSDTKSVYVFHISTSHNRKLIASESAYDSLLPGWILKLRELPCVPDTRGFYRKPCEIFRRTSETEPLMDIEYFIDLKYDTESNRAFLNMLGVCDTPIGPDGILNRLRALSKSSNPPSHEVDKWYLRLDQMINNCSTDDFLKIKDSFSHEKIILTEAGNWVNQSNAFLISDELDVLGSETIRSTVKDLVMWRKIEIAERPTADLAIKWLKELPVDKSLDKDELKRVKILLQLHGMRIWNECGKWLNLTGEWISIENINYSITMQSLIPWSHLHEFVKEKTADFLNLTGDLTLNPPFSNYPTLASQIENRFHEDPQFVSHPEKKVWLNQLGQDLCRIVQNDENSERIKLLAEDLSETMWQVTPGLETIPYIDGVPVGTPRRVEVMWLDNVLYVDDLTNAKLARHVPDVLSNFFNDSDITAALSYCYGRSPQDVTEYLEENFDLLPQEEIEIPVQDEEKIEKDENHKNKDEITSQKSTEEKKKQTDVSVSNAEESDETSSEGTVIQNDDQEDDNFADSEAILDEVTSDTDEVEVSIKYPPSKPPKPSIMEQFALSQGYKKEGKDTFFHPNGNRIYKVNHGSLFPWENLSATGDLIYRFWPKNHCLEHEPLQLEAELWGMIDKYPDTCSLILTNPEGKPTQLSGDDLCSMRENGKITLHPATYRIVYENDNQ